MYFGSVELPAQLIDAHAAGRLVIFVGAGASIGRPSSLPSFEGLVGEIRDGSNLSSVFSDEDLKRLPLDEILGRLRDDYGVDVHRRVFEIVSRKDSRPAPLHKAIAALSSASTIRIVTTNYDVHLSSVLGDHDLVEYLAPALPLGDDFAGMVYLHGRLDQEHHRLIVTDEDFGKAYLTDAWAARFLDRMFGEYPVLFVGYSHNDTIMKYLARGLGRRADKRYALTSDPDTTFWRRLGISAICCPREEQAAVLNDWATRSTEGLLGTRDRVRRIVADQEPSPVPEAVSFLEEVLANRDSVRFFCEFARGDGWLQWVSGRHEFASVFHSSPNIDPEITRELANWFAETYILDDNESDTAFELAVNAGGALGDDLSIAVVRQLMELGPPLSERVRRWLLLVASGRNNRNLSSYLAMLLENHTLEQDSDVALFLIDYLSEPMILPASSFSQILGARFEPSMRESDASLRDAWERIFRPHLGEFSHQLLDIVERHLRRADLQLRVAGDDDRRRPSSIYVSSISVGTGIGGSIGLLVDIGRECLEKMLEAGGHDVEMRLRSWQSSEVVLLRRLAVLGWTQRQDVTGDEKTGWLLGAGWLTDYQLREEIGGLVSESCSSASDQSIASLVDAIREHWEEDKYAPRRAKSLLKLISESAEASSQEPVIAALAELQAAHPELVENENAVESVSEPGNWAAAPPSDKLELHRQLVDEPKSTVEALVKCESSLSGWDDERRWEALAGAMRAVLQESPDLGLVVLDEGGNGRSLVERVVVQGWSVANPDDALASIILKRIAAMQIEPILGNVTSMIGGFVATGEALVEWFRYDESEELAKKCWLSMDPTTTSFIQRADDHALLALNHPAGHLAEYWVDRIGHLWRMAEDSWRGIPPNVADYIAEMIEGNDSRSESAVIRFCGFLAFFHSADPIWCKQYLFPLLIWNDSSSAAKAWSGFLSHGQWSQKLLDDGFLGMLIGSVPHREDLDGPGQRHLPFLLAKVAVAAETNPSDWLADFVTSSEVSDRVSWAQAIGRELGKLDAASAEQQWERWIGAYVRDRIRSVPRMLDSDEASAMLSWPLALTTSLEQAIDLILEVETSGLENRDLFLHNLTDERIALAPQKIAELLYHVLKDTAADFYMGHLLKDVHNRLKFSGVNSETLRRIEEEAMRLGFGID